jgi:pimeloyl-ACP methyl ester carboxylesterase
MRESVVLVHGIWMNGIEFWRLRQNLTRAGYECHVYKYHVWGKSLAETATRLHDFVETLDTPIVHFVGHSLGGIVLMHLFDQFPFIKKGRVVLLASPVNGSVVSKRLASTSLTRWTLGQSKEKGLGGDVPVWKGLRDIGTISGSFPLGVGLFVGGLHMPHDGTVSVEETELKGATDCIVMPVGHMTMLLSLEAAQQVIIFLRTGRFDEDTMTAIPDSGMA